jgi:hypothetical protein
VALNETPLARIPFLVRDELTILSMAQWMRFVAVVKMIASVLTGFIVLVGMIFIGSELGASPQPALGKLGRLVFENPIVFFVLGFSALGVSVVGTVLGYILYRAADDFERVARTDAADQDYITAGIIQLNSYFKLSILLGVAIVLVAITAGIGLAARLSVGS